MNTLTPIVKKFASLKITTACVFWLFVLTFWGTVAQVDNGLYAAQDRFFNSLYFLVWGFLPLPGAQGILWVMFLNLCSSIYVHFIKLRTWRSAGLKLTHLGVFIYFIAAFATFRLSIESHVRLAEGESTNVSTSYHLWEIAVWKKESEQRVVNAVSLEKIKPGTTFNIGGLTMTLLEFYPNCEAFVDGDAKPQQGKLPAIVMIKPAPMDKEREKNLAGALLMVDGKKIPLYGGNEEPINISGRSLLLRHQHYLLPFTIRLKKFSAKFHPGTKVASSYESVVEVVKDGVTRDVRIFMNNPLREKDLTFYQASYDTDSAGRQHSTLAVVKNAGQVLPYAACLIVFLGLSLHFILAALERKKR